jgi:uncharacterized protein
MTEERQTIPARYGKALVLERGQDITVINTHGTQVVDTWAFNRQDLTEYMSMAHTRSFHSKLLPAVGESFMSARRRPILAIVGDTSPGVHDVLLPACNEGVYRELGCTTYHRNCQDNLHEALSALGVRAPVTPAPLNLFMNVRVGDQGAILRDVPVSAPGDYVRLRAEMDLVLAFSACPQDITPINGPDHTPKDAHYTVHR